MSSNLLKMGFVPFADSEKRVIDTNELVAKRIEELAAKMSKPENAGFVDADEDGFAAGLDAERIEGLLSDEDGEAGNVIKAPDVPVPDLEQVRREAGEILAKAKEDAAAQQEIYLKEARQQIEAERANVLAQAKEQGYAEGFKKAENEFARKEQDLKRRELAMEAEYDKLLESLETEMIDALSGIYEHLFQVELSSYRGVLVHLLTSALRKIEGGRDFLVHISPEDYPYVSMEKKQLSAVISPSATLELVEDHTLKKNECMIETEGGIFDCGLGTQLSELGRKLKLLSYEKA